MFDRSSGHREKGAVLKLGFVAGAMAALLGMASGATAQTEAEFVAAFAGEWRVFDESFAQGAQICRITLGQEAQDGRYKLDKASCGGELAEVAAWGLADGQMALLAAQGEAVVSLGGTQRRMSGTTKSGKPVILERAGVVGAAEQIQAALRASGCYYLGFSDRCAAEADLGKPAAGSADSPLRIKVIANLNARTEARDDANVIGVVPANSCVAASVCVTASDGVWCRAEFGERTGWLRKLAIRQNRWPIVTFLNKCDD